MANGFFSFGDDTLTGKVFADLTVDYCKDIDGGVVSSVGCTLAEIGMGAYGIENPNIATKRGLMRAHLTDDPSKSTGEIVFNPVDGDEAKETTVAALPILAEMLAGGVALETTLTTIAAYVDELESRLSSARAALLDNLDAKISTRATLAEILGAKTSSTIVQQSATVEDGSRQQITRGDVKTLEFIFTSGFPLAGAEKVYLMAKKDPAAADSTAIFDKLCTIVDAAARKVSVTLSGTETTKDPGVYQAEVEIRAADETNPRTPVAFELEIRQDVRHGS